MEQTTSLKRTKIPLPNISPRSWEHPADRAALVALKKVPGLDQLLQKVVGVTTEKSIRLITLASAVRVSGNQFPKVHRLHQEACAILGIEKAPELYVAQTPFLNARAVGVEHPFIVLNSSMVEQLNEEELLSVIGHELGHCLSGHTLYKTLLALLLKFSTLASNIPLGGVSVLPIIIALREWDRKSELSADRAGLLVAQDPQTCYNLQMKLAGGSNLSQMDINEFFLQAADYQNSGSVIDSVHKLLNILGQNHPFPVLRLVELKSWVDSGAYDRILASEYLRHEQAKDEDVLKSFRDAARAYRDDFRSSSDPLVGKARDAAADAAEAVETIKGKAKDIFDYFFKENGARQNGDAPKENGEHAA
jgi:Zn-dependent protease with chaperone function